MKRPDITIEHARPASRQWRTWATTEPSLAGLSWDRFRHQLRHGPAGRQDDLLTALVHIARTDRDAVTIVAACLVPGLRARIAAHAPGLPADDAWGEAVTGLCAAIDAIDLSVGFVASRLLDVVRRHLQRAVKHEAVWRGQVRDVPDRPGHERVDEPSGALILTTAARAGVTSRRDAWLMHATFLAGHSVEFAAGHLEVSYEAAKKRRQRAGERWRTWWSPEHLATTTTATEGGGHEQLRRA